MPRVVHFEIAVDDPESVGRFYTDVFGWKIERWEGGEQDYWLVTTGDDSEPGINGGMMRREAGFAGTTNTLGVDSVDAYLERVTAAGGQVVVPPVEIPGTGRVAYCSDPGGTVFGVFETTGGDGDGGSA